ncbi:hypothetical protein [Paenibacillus cremeus]|uniref:DNRLRE domain-containing protein n=1 Tax=Paenibacillus cremeus TaxID=2163881 RepID=A0A559K5Q3_9BACL|nr:hypothetical protein [Paenibacillus cremeus]TVY07454.1 hypothetical protein FPZ49_24140 [Paenibacillus cremeus]
MFNKPMYRFKKTIHSTLAALLIGVGIFPVVNAAEAANAVNLTQTQGVNPLPGSIWLSPSDDVIVDSATTTTQPNTTPTNTSNFDVATLNASSPGTYNIKRAGLGAGNQTRIAFYRFNVDDAANASQVYFKISGKASAATGTFNLSVYGTTINGTWTEADLTWVNASGTGTGKYPYLYSSSTSPFPSTGNGVQNVASDFASLVDNNPDNTSANGPTAWYFGDIPISTVTTTTDFYVDVTNFVKKFGTNSGKVTFIVQEKAGECQASSGCGGSNVSSSTFYSKETSTSAVGFTLAPQLIVQRSNFSAV